MRTTTTRRLALSSLLAASALSLAACGGSTTPAAGTSTVTSTAVVAAPSSATAATTSTTTATTTSTQGSGAAAAGTTSARPARTETAPRPTSAPATASSTTSPNPEDAEDAPDQGSDRVIVLGGSSGHDKGFGWSRPSRVYLGGDPTGDLTNVRWDGWGLDVAEGTGTSMYVPQGTSVADAVRDTARVRAWAPGRCHGKVAYTKVAWWFPSHGQTGPVDVIDACR